MFERIIHPKMKVLSLFSHADIVSSMEHKQLCMQQNCACNNISVDLDLYSTGFK